MTRTAGPARRNRIATRHIAIPLLLLTAAGCGGDKGTGPNPPPPPPAPANLVVTTIDISPGAATIEAEDTVRLTATVRDQNGAAMTGKTVTWTSQATAVATVSGSGLVTAVTAGQASIVAAVDGKQGAAQVTVTAEPVVLEAGRSATATIGTQGGSVATTANGVSYTLEVPAGALGAKTQITVTPVRTLRGLPAGGEFVAGVKFEPSGLVFRQPAMLRVIQPVTPAPGKALVGYLASDAGTMQALALSTRRGDTLTLAVPHFTIAGWGQFTHSQLTVIVPTLPGNTGVPGFLNQLVSLPPDSPVGPVQAIFEQWYTTLVKPELDNVTGNTTAENAQAANDFRVWEQVANGADGIFNLNGALKAALQPLRQQGIGLLRPVLTFAIASMVAECPTATPALRPMSIAEEVFVLQDIAAAYGLATPVTGLDTPSVVALLVQCAKVVNTLEAFPPNPTPNVTAQLDLRYGLLLGGGTSAVPDIPFKVTLTLSGSTTDGSQVTQTDLTGFITGPVTPTGQRALVVDLTSCIHPIMGYRLDEICVHHQVIRSFGITVNGSVSVQSQVGLQQINNVGKITGSLFITSTPGNPITSTDLRELSQLTEVGGSILIASVPSLTSLAGLGALTKVGQSLVIQANPGLAALTGLGGLATVDQVRIDGNATLASLDGLQGITTLTELAVTNSPLLPNLGGLLNLRQVGTLRLTELPLVQSLQSLRAVQVTRGFAIIKMAGLTTLAGLNAVAPTLTEAVFVSDNPVLADLAALAPVTSARSIAIIGNPVLPDVDELASLTGTTQGLEISGLGLTSLAGLSGLRTGSLKLDLWLSPQVTNVSLPSLTDAGTIQIQAIAVGCHGQHVTVSAPALTRAVGFGAGVGAGANCTMSVSVPQLATVDGLGIGGNITSIALPGSVTAGTFSIGSTQLTSLTLPALTVDNLTVSGHPLLTSLGGGGGRVRKGIAIQNNPRLSTQAARTWADTFDHTGATVTISGNQIP